MPVDPISIGATLLGGLLGRSRARYVVPNYAQIRARAEAAGFNPLTALTSAPGSVVTDDNSAMGSAIANAGLMAAEGLKANSAAAKLSQAQMETRKLKQQLVRATLRPKTPGVYAGNMAVPEAASALGFGGDNASGSGAAVPSGAAGQRGVGPSGGDGSELTPFFGGKFKYPHALEHASVATDPGYVIIDNPFGDGDVKVPAVQGEPLDMLQAGMVGLSWAWDRGKKRYERFARERARRGFTGAVADTLFVGPAYLAARRGVSQSEANLRAKYGSDWWQNQFPLSGGR